jgi:hypothetical protein
VGSPSLKTSHSESRRPPRGATSVGGWASLRVSLARSNVVVIDDLLPAASLQAVTEHARRARYRSVHADHWNQAWRLSDGAPLRGPVAYLSRQPRAHPWEATRRRYPLAVCRSGAV